MRGRPSSQPSMLALVNPEQFVPRDHPIRRIKALADEVLRTLDIELTLAYAEGGRHSVPPERLLKALLLQALFSIRSERQLCEHLRWNLMYRWFLDMDLTEEPFDATTFCKNRERLLQHDVAASFFRQVVELARRNKLMSEDHFSVDGTLIEAWGSLKSVRPKAEKPGDRPPPDDPGNPTVDFRGDKRTNDTHASTTDPEARLARKGKGKEAKLSYAAHGLMEHKNGLLVDLEVARMDEMTEREAAIVLLDRNRRNRRRITVAGDRGYDTKGFVQACRSRSITPHVARNPRKPGGSSLDGRTVRHAGYAVSQRIRKRIEEIFGWLKTVGGLRRTRFKGRDRTKLSAWIAGAAYNLVRMSRLAPAPA